MSKSLSRRLAAVEVRHSSNAKARTFLDADMLSRSVEILIAYAPLGIIESFGERLDNGSTTEADRQVLQQIAQAGYPDPVELVRTVIRIDRSI